MKKFLTLILLSLLINNLNAQDTITLNPSNPGLTVSPDFTGLSYEMESISVGFFKSTNATLVQYFRTIGVKVLRMGGNSGDIYQYYPLPNLNQHPVDTILNNGIDSLFAFANAVGCKVIFGLNLGTFNPSLSAQEATYIMQHYSSQLLAFEIGNEPNLFYLNGLRPANYTYADFQAEFMQYVDSIKFYNPTAPISGATAARYHGLAYTIPFSQNMHGVISLLNHHNYGISDTIPNIPQQLVNLLSPAALDTELKIVDTLVYCATTHDSVPFRMSECNSMFPYGQWGVGNSFAASLWCLDYMYSLAKANCTGVNFHTFNGSPSTAIHDTLGVYEARPLYYGILAFQYGKQGRFLPVQSTDNALNLNTYSVLDSSGNIYVTLINKDTLNPVPIMLDAGNINYNVAAMVSLSASSVGDTFGVTVAGSPVLANGSWTPGAWTPVNYVNGYFSFTIPGGTAYILKLNSPLTGVNNIIENQNVVVYPNPASSILTLHSQLSILNSQFVITDVLGNEIYHQPINNSSESTIDISQLSNGIYFWQAISDKEILARGKIAVQR